ncbi:type II toxin-antitoxin system Phd/YefM family antitoxin [Spongisporangium articulatum]|uniref:Antitoxin n=1 Tax=Spongisporangium articulatum TaxID=3362603 RepID=A0ABW8AQN4_9ACTN
MTEVGIRALKQNASAVVAQVARGERVTITDRGRPVARLVPIAESPLERWIESGLARPPRRSLADLPLPEPMSEPGPTLSEVLAAMRDDERY